MKRAPCEHIVWRGLPAIRKEIAKSMINDYCLNQKLVAEKLGISHAAVSQYMSGKRGSELEITDKNIKKEIKKSAGLIIKKGDEVLVSETCRICKIVNFIKFFDLQNK